MLISKIVFNESAAFKEIFNGGYALHQAVWDLFADSPDRRRDFLYRLECVGRLPLVYTVSSRVPIDIKGLWHIETKEYSPRVEPGMKLGFSVRVNPTLKRDGKRHDVVMDAKYKIRKNENNGEVPMQELIVNSCGKWLEKRAQETGFKTKQFRADGYQQIRFNKTKDSTLVRYSAIDITGILEIVDQKLFVDMLLNGLGPEKGFGCGLMLIKKI